MPMAGALPPDALGVSICVILYSIVCLCLSTLLVCLLVSFRETWSFVTIFSAFTSLSTCASIAEQIHFAIAWKSIKQAAFESAVESLKTARITYKGAVTPVDLVLYYIQFYSYNVMTLNILFWSVALFAGSWNIRPRRLERWRDQIPVFAKILSVIFPLLIVSLMQVDAIVNQPILFIIMTFSAIGASLVFGSIFLALTLYRYVRSRRLLAEWEKRGAWWASESDQTEGTQASALDGMDEQEQEADTESNRTSATTSSPLSNIENGGNQNSGLAATPTQVLSKRKSIYDRNLITRFSIGFAVLVLFEVAISMVIIYIARMNHTTALSGHPDFSTKTAISDACVYIPGVSASLVSFLIFGTTKSWRQYRDFVISCSSLRRKPKSENGSAPYSPPKPRGVRLQDLPNLNKSESEKDWERKQEAESRIKMFVRERYTPATASTEFSPPLQYRDSQDPLILEPKAAMIRRPHGRGASWDVETGDGMIKDDIVIQYEQRKHSGEGMNWADNRSSWKS